MGVALFANKEVLGGRQELMHRKIFRVGDEVVFGGMNANKGSRENVDFATSIQGPGAKALVDNFARDVALSRGKGVEEIYGNQLNLVKNSDNVSIKAGGLLDLLDATYGEKAGLKGDEPLNERVDRLLTAARESGTDPAGLADFGGADVRDFLLNNRGSVRLTEEGTRLLTDGLEENIAKLGSAENQDSLSRISSPDATAKGSQTLAVGDNKVERQAMVLHAIDSAEKYIKVSAFVLNEDLARLLVQKKKDMAARGEDFQVQVVLDPGLYEYGGTPNEPAYKLLEKEGVQVKWAALERTDPAHDRKVHAKLLITDKEMLTGSTNFSTKGLRDNWEITDVAFFNQDDAESVRTQEKVNADFDRLWNKESLDINTVALAEKKYAGYLGRDGAVLKEEYRGRVLRSFLREINNYEQESGEAVQRRLAPARAHGSGAVDTVPVGYEALKTIGDAGVQEIRDGSEAWQRLQELRRRGL
jgi:phosphatidylserine/phosphatidylglycerophosphate/cardiolipin synthase-like enzyme